MASHSWWCLQTTGTVLYNGHYWIVLLTLWLHSARATVTLYFSIHRYPIIVICVQVSWNLQRKNSTPVHKIRPRVHAKYVVVFVTWRLVTWVERDTKESHNLLFTEQIHWPWWSYWNELILMWKWNGGVTSSERVKVKMEWKFISKFKEMFLFNCTVV